MKKKASFKNIILILFSLSLCSIFMILSINDLNKNNSLKKNKKYINAIVLNIEYGTRQRRYINYEFFINKKRYYGRGRYYPKQDLFSIGDTILVIYDKTDPYNNKTEVDYNNLIIK